MSITEDFRVEFSAFPVGLFTAIPANTFANNTLLAGFGNNLGEAIAANFWEPLLQEPLLIGSAAADTFVGQDQPILSIWGGAGNDMISGGMGHSLLLGNAGDDILRGDRNSRSPGGSIGGDDILLGGEGNDRLGGKGGNDWLVGGFGDDALWGDAGHDVVYGGPGNDVLTGDDFSGGTGDDLFVLVLGEGTDTITDFGNGADRLLLLGLMPGAPVNLVEVDGDTRVTFGDETLAVLTNVVNVPTDVLIRVQSVNQAPVVAADQTLIVAEDSDPVPLAIAPPADADNDPLTITVSSLPNEDLGQVQLTDGRAITIGQQLSLDELQSLQFVTLPDANGNAGIFGYTVADGRGGIASQATSVSIRSVNDAPVLTLPTVQSTVSGEVLALSGIAVTDVDVHSGELTVSISALNGLLRLDTTDNLTFIPTGPSSGANNAALTITFQGTLDAINAGLQSLTYQNNDGFTGEEIVTITVDDQGQTGEGGVLSDTEILLIEVFSPVVDLPQLQAALSNDTGTDNTDGLTIDPTITGQITSQSIITTLQGQLNGGAVIDLSDALNSDNTFTLSLTQYEQLTNGSMPSGDYTLELTAVNELGQESLPVTLSFTLDAIAPLINFDLAPESDTGVQGDRTTTARRVNLVGQTEPELLVTLVGTGQQATADSQGYFTFADIAMPLVGAAPFTVVTTDLAGNVGRDQKLLRREGINGAPLITSLPQETFNATQQPTYAYQVEATDPDGDGLTYTLIEAPSDAAIDATTGLVTFTPSGILQPAYDFVVEVTDGRGGKATQNFTLTDPVVSAATGEIRGLVWHDLNPNGSREDEPGLSGVAIYLDVNQNGQLDANESLQITAEDDPNTPNLDEAGQYAFTNLLPGTYQIRAVIPANFEQTFPEDGAGVNFYTINLDAGETVENIDFGNAQISNQAPIIISEPVTDFRVLSTTGEPESVDLSNWDVIQYGLGGAANWDIQPDNTTVIQRNNSEPSILLSDFNLTSDRIAGTWQVAPTEGEVVPGIYLDDDLIGFVFGYQNSGQFYLFDWKQANQNDPLGFAARGMSLKVVNADSPLTGADFWPTQGNGDRVQTIFRNDIPWQRITEYGFTLDFLPGEFTITITEGNTVLESFTIQDDAYTSGKFGFYNYSQGQVIYEGFTQQTLVSQQYAYGVNAIDADQDSLTYSLTEAPTGMTIDPNSGLLAWKPETVSPGDRIPVTVLVEDGRGGSDQQSFLIDILGESNGGNRRPQITSQPAIATITDSPYLYQVTAVDLDGDPLTYRLVNAPDGMMINPDGILTWEANAVGSYPIEIQVEDDKGGLATQRFDLTVAEVINDVEAPLVNLGVSSAVLNLGETLALDIQGFDNVGLADLDLFLNGESLSLSPGIATNGRVSRASVLLNQAGVFEVLAIATDAAGNTATETIDIRVIDPSDTTAPLVEIDTSPFANGAITLESLTNILGTVQDDNLEFFRLEIAPIASADINNPSADDPDYIVLAEGNSNVINDVLGAVDPRKLANGSYFLRAIAGDFSGNINLQGLPVTLYSAEDSGQFQIEINDLTIPLAGLPIEINRIYNSFESREVGDFGFGWRLGVQDAQIEESVPVTDFPGASSLFNATPMSIGDTVTLTNPDGQRVSFIFDPVIETTSLLGTIWEPRFTPLPGVFDRLEVDDLPLSQRSDGTFGLAFIPLPYNPSEYRLITRDGTAYTYDQFEGLTSIEDLRGNTLTYTDNGIFSSTGANILFERDSQGRITTITDPNGNAITYTYDANGDLITVTDQANLTVTHDYFDDGSHLLDTITDPQGRLIIRTEFDNFGRITKTTDALGNVSTRIYTDNPDGTITEVFTNPAGQTVTTVRDTRGNVISETDAVGATTTIFYNDNSNPIQITDARGNTTTRTYDDRGNVLSIIDANGNTRRFTYDNQNNLLTNTDELDRVTEFVYDDRGNLIEIIDAAGESVTFAYDAFGRVERFTDAKGNFSQYDYTPVAGVGALALNKPTKVTFADGSSQEFAYNAFGQTTRVVDQNGSTTEYITDNAGRLITLRDPLGNETNYTYDAQYITQVTNALGQTAQFEYDDAGRVIRQIDPEGGVIEFEYDSLGREIRETVYLSITDPTQQRTTRTTYREDGLIASIGDGAGNTSRFEYDLVGNQTAVIDPLGQRTEFIYDALNRQTQQIDPLGNVTTYEYDDVGNIVTVVDSNGRRRTFTYDQVDQRDLETWFDGNTPIRTIDYDYDAVGNLIRAVDPDSRLAFFYNNRDRLAQVDYTGTPGLDGVTLTYTYDGAGNVLSVVDSFGTAVTSTYDPRNLLTQREWQGVGVDPLRADFTYNTVGDLMAVTRYADLAGTQKIGSSRYSYDAAQRLTGITHRAAIDQVLADYAYELNAAGDLIRETRNGETYAYTYDDRAQLVEVDRSSGADESYNYDANGNRESSSVHGNGYVTGDNNRLKSDGVYTYDYDNQGNLIRRTEVATGAVREFTWDHRDRLVGITDAASNGSMIHEITYTYDALDRRLSETINGETTYFVSDGQTLWAEINAANEVIARYLPGAEVDELLARDQAEEGTAWYLTDRLNTVRNVVDAVGNLINEIEYDSFGRKLSETNPEAGDRFGFTGREYDEDTGLYYYRARYYDPELGRFISPDPIGFEAEDSNLYRYVGNAPVNATDPSGLITAISYSYKVAEFAGVTVQAKFTVSTSEVIGAIDGFFRGFSTTGLIFIGEILALTSDGNLSDQDLGVALEKTKAKLENITTDLTRFRAFDTKKGYVGAFISGVRGRLEPKLSEVIKKAIFLSGNSPSLTLGNAGGFKDGYALGLEFIRAKVGI